MEVIRKEMIPALITTILMGIIGYSLGLFEVEELTDLVIPAVVLLVLFILIAHFYRPIRRQLVIWSTKAELEQNGFDQKVKDFKNTLSQLVETPNGSELSAGSGLVGWRHSFDACQSRLQSLLVKATSVKLLTHIGKSDVGKGTMFYNTISRNRLASVKILLCSEDSPYISADFAVQIGHKKEQALIWKRRVLETHDDILFVTASLNYKGQENHLLPVYEIVRSTNHEQRRLFEMFDRYFEREWERSDETF